MRLLLGCITLSLVAVSHTRAEPSQAFSYQGRLDFEGAPVDLPCDFKFSVYDGESGGTLLAGPIEKMGLPVVDGTFAALLDFGDQSGWWEVSVSAMGEPLVVGYEPRFLGIEVRCEGDDEYSVLLPRQPIAPTPMALKSIWSTFQTSGQLVSVADVPPTFQETFAGVDTQSYTGEIASSSFALPPQSSSATISCSGWVETVSRLENGNCFDDVSCQYATTLADYGEATVSLKAMIGGQVFVSEPQELAFGDWATLSFSVGVTVDDEALLASNSTMSVSLICQWRSPADFGTCSCDTYDSSYDWGLASVKASTSLLQMAVTVPVR